MVALPALVCLILFAVLTLIPQLYMSRNQTGQQAQSMRMMAVVMTVMMLWMGWSPLVFCCTTTSRLLGRLSSRFL